MSPHFTHPLVLTLWTLAVATLAIFGMLTLSNLSTYRVLRQPEVRIYTGFTTCGALLAACVAASFLPTSPLFKSQLFRLMWVSGAAGLGFWVWSLVTFARCDSRLFTWLRRGFFAIATFVFVDMVAASTTGGSLFFSLDPLPTESVTQLAAGNVFRYRATGTLVGTVAIVMTMTTSVALLRALLRLGRRDRWLIFGVTLTPVFACAEVALGVTQSKYSMPLLFVAKLVEAARISWASRDRLVHELNEIRAARRDQAALLESQLQQLEFNSRLAKVGQRTAELSHDMRNPLTTVVATLDLVETTLKAQPPDVKDALELLGDMRVAVDHVLELVRRITRQASDPVLPPRLISVKQVVSNALVLCQQRLSGTTVTVHVPGELWVLGWSTELTQVLVNLLVNSCDALSGHSSPWIRIDALDADGQLELRVADAGRRPPDAIVDKMFVTRFTTGTTSASTGLGLTICAQIIRQHRGAVFVDRRCGNTTIVVQLPLAQREVQDAA